MRVLPPQTTNPATSSNFHHSHSPSASTAPVQTSAPPFTRARHARTNDAAGSTTSAFADPALPRPAPFSADAEDQADDPAQVRALVGGGDLGEEGRPAVELEVEFGYRRRVERKREDEGADGKVGERGKGKVEPMDPTENIHFVAYLDVGVVRLAAFLRSFLHIPLRPHLIVRYERASD